MSKYVIWTAHKYSGPAAPASPYGLLNFLGLSLRKLLVVSRLPACHFGSSGEAACLKINQKAYSAVDRLQFICGGITTLSNPNHVGRSLFHFGLHAHQRRALSHHRLGLTMRLCGAVKHTATTAPTAISATYHRERHWYGGERSWCGCRSNRRRYSHYKKCHKSSHCWH